jgi:F0F1-type ATP synthase assembly protein I
MALINSGRTAKIFDSNDTESNKSLKTGLFLLSVGLGLLAGMVIDNILDTEPAGVFVCMLIFGGISLIYYHNYVERKGKASTKRMKMILSKYLYIASQKGQDGI